MGVSPRLRFGIQLFFYFQNGISVIFVNVGKKKRQLFINVVRELVLKTIVNIRVVYSESSEEIT